MNLPDGAGVSHVTSRIQERISHLRETNGYIGGMEQSVNGYLRKFNGCFSEYSNVHDVRQEVVQEEVERLVGARAVLEVLLLLGLRGEGVVVDVMLSREDEPPAGRYTNRGGEW